MKNILIIEGDGIGPEVCAQVEKIINYLNDNSLADIKITKALLGGAAIDAVNTPIPDETIELAKKSDAILLGAVGGPKWESLDISMRPEKGLLGIRKALDLFANLRPAIVFEELASASSLKKEIVSGLDILIVRELTGGIYFGQPRGIREENGQKIGFNTLVYSQDEIKRIGKVAFELAQKRNGRLCSVDKANVLESTELWREEMETLHNEYPDVEYSNMYVDNASMQLVRNPKQFDVIVTTNMFGDILSDTAAMLTGSLGMLPSASLSSPGKPGLYEPVHGSAPDIAGQNIANPIATILSFVMMLRFSLEMPKIADKIENAIKEVLANDFRSADIYEEGKIKLSTEEMGDKIIEFMK